MSAEATESLLIRACISPDEAFEESFRAFENHGSLDDLNEGTMRLIPFLYRRLERLDVSARNHGILKGIYARYWYLHHMFRSHGLTQSAEILGDIPFLVLKGQAFQHILYGGDAPTRPGDDTDILVPTSLRLLALDRFRRAGFVPKFPRTHAERTRLNPSTALERHGVDIDLHWQFYPPATGANPVEMFFNTAVPFTSGSQSFQTPSANHHLAHTLIHGWGKNEVSPIRWVLDAAHLVGHRDLNWERFTDDVSALGWQSPVGLQLQHLRDEFHLPIPPSALEALDARKPTRHQSRLLNHALMPKNLGKIAFSVMWIRPFYFRATSSRQNLGWLWSTISAIALSVTGLSYRLTHKTLSRLPFSKKGKF